MLSFSLPNSTTSSPSRKSNKGKSNWSRTRPPSGIKGAPPDTDTTLSKGCCSIQLTRSKSCGEGRASTPSLDEFDLCFKKGNAPNIPPYGATMKTHDSDSDLLRVVTMGETNNTTPKRISTNQGFTCGGALCIFLPTFSKAKTDKLSAVNEVDATTAEISSNNKEIEEFFSKRVSMAKFEWGSRSSAAIICKDEKENDKGFTQEDDQEDDSMNLYFDLPMELMRCTANDSPEKAAFIFTSYQGHTKTFSHNNSSDPLISSPAKD